VKPEVPVVAFEPIQAEAEIYRRVISGFGGARLHEIALGDSAKVAKLHISRSADNSSLLASSPLQQQLFPGTQEIGTQEVSVMTLDNFIGEWKSYSRILLKIDVQGVELSVLKGATETLKRCTHVYVECSQVELYVGQALYRDVVDFLEQQGHKLQDRCNEILRDGKLIQADYLFAPK
jgi:FkbM family methyltransferase